LKENPIESDPAQSIRLRRSSPVEGGRQARSQGQRSPDRHPAGSAAVQLGKHFGATVTAVCSGANVEMVKALGADRVIDYTKEDFTTKADTYDLIFDIVGATSFRRCRHTLKPDGVFLQNIMGLTGIVWRGTRKETS
jgi:hypothetical protein